VGGEPATILANSITGQPRRPFWAGGNLIIAPMPSPKKTITVTLDHQDLCLLKMVLNATEDLFTINQMFDESCAKLNKEKKLELNKFVGIVSSLISKAD